MTLISIGRKLVSADARPLGRDAVVDAVLAVKHSRETPTPDLLDALRSVGPVSADLVVTDREWIDGRPVLTFAVEDYAPLDDVPEHLYRYAETAAGVWWSASKLDAWREGSGRHETPSMWMSKSDQLDVLASFRCRFGRQYAPSEYVAVRR